MAGMRRRDFIAAVGSTAVSWPCVGRAQQPGMPLIGFLDTRSPDVLVDRLRGFRRGLNETGYVEGENVAIDYRWADNQLDKIPMQAAELVRRQVAVIVASGGPFVVLAVKAVTTTIPIVFLATEDPVRLGLVANLARPGGNITGINFLSGELTGKRLELLRGLVPSATRGALLVNPANAAGTEATLHDVQVAARTMGLQIQVLKAGSIGEIDAAFAALVRERAEALFVGADSFFQSRRLQLSLLAMRHAVPATYSTREFAEAGGLLTYGSNVTDAYREASAYTGRVLKGAKPADLPVVQSSKFEMVINAQTARILGLEVPPTLLARADEVIE
jgi:ABC-type uncharacterized transport system substrate-binding protein